MSYRIRVPDEGGGPEGWVALIFGIWTLTTDSAKATTWKTKADVHDRIGWNAPQRIKLTGVVEEVGEPAAPPMVLNGPAVVGTGLRPISEPRIDPVLLAAMKTIARGHRDQSRPYGGETARQIMREALTQCGIDW